MQDHARGEGQASQCVAGDQLCKAPGTASDVLLVSREQYLLTPTFPCDCPFGFVPRRWEGRTCAGRRHALFYGRASSSFPQDGSGLSQAVFEEMFRPSAGRHGGVLTETKDYQFCLRIVCVGRRLGFIHGLCGNDFTRARRIEICHATRIISGGTGESGYVRVLRGPISPTAA